MGICSPGVQRHQGWPFCCSVDPRPATLICRLNMQPTSTFKKGVALPTAKLDLDHVYEQKLSLTDQIYLTQLMSKKQFVDYT